MLKDIGNVFERRKKILEKFQGKSLDIKDHLKVFLRDKFGNDLNGFSIGIDYNSQDNSLIITSGNKILANEITLQLADLAIFLKEKNIKVSKILVR